MFNAYLSHGVMVAHQILVLLAQVRILVGQQNAEWRKEQKKNLECYSMTFGVFLFQ